MGFSCVKEKAFTLQLMLSLQKTARTEGMLEPVCRQPNEAHVALVSPHI